MTEPVQPALIRHAGRSVDPRDALPAREASGVTGRSPGAGVRSVVQFRRPLTRDERARVRQEHGLALTDYLPDGAYLESVPAERLGGLEGDPLVSAVMAFGADLRRPATGGRRALVRRERRRHEVALFLDADLPTVLAALADLGAVEPVVLDDRPHGGTVKVRFQLDEPMEQALTGIAELDDVRWLDEVGEAKLDTEPLTGSQAGPPAGSPAGPPAVSPDGAPIVSRAGAPTVSRAGAPTASPTVSPTGAWIEASAVAQAGMPVSAPAGMPAAAPVSAPAVASAEAPVAGAPLARAWAAPLWRLGLTGAGQVIGVMDSPIDLGHRFFADPQHQVGPSHRKVAGYRNAVAEPPAPHGTFVAGIAAGDDPVQPGGHPDRGVAWAARLTYGNDDDIEQTGVLAALAAAVADGAHVHTNSWHDEPEIQYDQLAADLDTFTWNNEDHLVLGSAGNRGERMGPPGTAKNVLCVAASQGPAPAAFGDGATGPAADGRQKPEVMAPGCSIRSTVAGTQAGVDLDRHVFASLTAICASSWATPAVAGLAALVRQYYVDGHHPTGALLPSAALLRATLLAGCRPDGGGPYPSGTGGWGGVRVDETLRGPLLVRDVRHADGLDTGESAELEVDVAGAARPLTVTLVWTDPPGLAGSDAPGVNALELTVVPPDGSPPLHGNVFAGGFSTPGPAARTEPVQRVLVRAPVPGRWTVRVTATAVNVGSPGQGYALAVLGDLAPANPA